MPAAWNLNDLARSFWKNITDPAMGDAVEQAARGSGFPPVMLAGVLANPNNLKKLSKAAQTLSPKVLAAIKAMQKRGLPRIPDPVTTDYLQMMPHVNPQQGEAAMRDIHHYLDLYQPTR